MTISIMLTRHYSGFVNVADRYSISNNEADGRAATDTYTLPAGYSVDADWSVIRDPEGYECIIVPHASGRPQLISLAGPISKQPVLQASARAA